MEEKKTLDMDEIMSKLNVAVQKEYGHQIPFNVYVIGKTGVGKSTLINSIFGKEVTETGIGKPVSKEVVKLTYLDGRLNIYDTPGIEIGGSNAINNIFDNIKENLIECQKQKNVDDCLRNMIHCILYCVSLESGRLEPTEANALEEFMSFCKQKALSLPVILVFTKSADKELYPKTKDAFSRDYPDLMNAFSSVNPVLAEAKMGIEPYGINELVDKIVKCIPDAVKKTFVSVQKANIELKKSAAHKTVAVCAAGAAAVGAIPIPFADAPLLITDQITMLAKITADFGLKYDERLSKFFIENTVGISVTTTVGKSLVKGLLKIFPGTAIVTAVISGTTAAAITAALGETYIWYLSKFSNGDLSYDNLFTDEIAQLIKDKFKEFSSIKRNKNGEPQE